MFDIGWSELLLIGVVALIAIGPKELPGALRTLGQWMGKIRRMASEFQNQFHDAMREAELAELKKEMDEMSAKAQSYAHFDPLDDIRKDIESAAAPPETLSTPLMEQPAEGSAAAPPSAPSLPASEGSAPAAPQETAGATTGEAQPDAAKPDAGRAA